MFEALNPQDALSIHLVLSPSWHQKSMSEQSILMLFNSIITVPSMFLLLVAIQYVPL